MQANRAIIASERAGTTIGLLLMDTERQAANYRESVNQTLESARRQHLRSIQATEESLKTEEMLYKVILIKHIIKYQV